MLLTMFRRAFNITDSSYTVPNGVEDDDDESLRRDGVVRGNSSSFEYSDVEDDDPGPRRWLLLGFAVFCLLAVASLTIQGHGKVVTPGTSSANDDNDQSNLICKDDPALASQSLIADLRHAAVATDQAVCSAMATKIMLDLGGNAVDAAVTAALCLGVANPSSSGIGGGAFLLVHAPVLNDDNLPEFIDARDDDSNSTTTTDTSSIATEVIDCRETAPAAAFAEMFDESNGVPSNASVLGGLAVAVPSELRCLELAHARFGKLEWSAVVAPVTALAQQGVPVSPYLAHVLQQQAAKYTQVQDDDDGNAGDWDYGLRALVTRTNHWKTVLTEGEMIHNYALGETLRAIQEHGVDAFYRDNAEDLAQEIQQAGGIVTADDLLNYRAVLRSPVTTRANGLRLVGVPPPSSGGAVVLGAVQFLSGFQLPLASLASTLSQHRLVEACKHGFAVRLSLSDPDYNTATVQEAVRDLTSEEYMRSLRETAYRDNETLPLSMYGGAKWAQLQDSDASSAANATDMQEGDRRRRLQKQRKLLQPFGYLEDRGTSHFSIVDRHGHAVAMTTSINTVFGSAVRSPSTGIIFGNTMDDFGKPGKANTFGLHPAESNYINRASDRCRPWHRPWSFERLMRMASHRHHLRCRWAS